MNTTRKRGGLGRILALTASLTMIVAGGVGIALASPASAAGNGVGNPNSPGNSGEHKITICHRTNSNTNPYVTITVDQDAADGDLQNDKGKGDHYMEHLGPVWNPTLKDQKVEWGDIIPPIPGIHGGRNWTTEGQAIYNSGCNPVEYSYSKQVTITKDICYGGSTILGATATGKKFTVTSYSPITAEQKAVVDADAQASAEAAFNEKFQGYVDGKCQSTDPYTAPGGSEDYCVDGKDVTVTWAGGSSAVSQQAADDQAAANKAAAYEKAGIAEDAETGTCPTEWSAKGGSNTYCVNGDNLTISWDGATSTKSQEDADALAAANKADAYAAAGVDPNATPGTCSPPLTYGADGGSVGYCVNDQNVTVAWAGTSGAPSQAAADAQVATNKANAYAAAGVDPNATAGDCSPVTTVEEPATVTAVAPATVTKPKPAKVVLPATVNGGVAGVPGKATLPASVPAGEGSDSLPLWAFALIALGLAGALGAGSRMLGARK